MRITAVLALVLVAACSGTTERSAASRPEIVTTTTTEALSPDEAYLDDLHGHVDFNNAEWGEQALALAKQVCGSLTASQSVLTDDAPNDSPETDASIADSYADMTLSVAYDSAGEDTAATAAVLVLGAHHFCPEWTTTVEDDAAARGLQVSASP